LREDHELTVLVAEYHDLPMIKDYVTQALERW
jgi:hypothetical protein